MEGRLATLTTKQKMLRQIVLVSLGAVAGSAGAASPDLTHLSIEQLMDIKVVSLTKQVRPLGDTASAIFVITQEDIRRSGVTSVPEALRLAPGVHVGRIDGQKWAVSIRGFNGHVANKLLVLVDGRSIYTPTFSGVPWEVQNLLLDDIERIEVIRGPGASLWGANAVNGVINILTKRAADTKNLATVTIDRRGKTSLGIRHSGSLSDNTHYRLSGKHLQQGSLLDAAKHDAEDEGELSSGGFRLDWTPSGQDRLTLQGDLYQETFQQNLLAPLLIPPYQRRWVDNASSSGGNLQGRWEHTFTSGAKTELKLYYQREKHADALLGQNLEIFDLDFQHAFTLNPRNALIWGLGYRHHQDRYTAAELGALTPASKHYGLFNFFVQDQIALIPDTLDLTVGAKLEHNDFTGWEFQPSARVLWSPAPQHRLWAAASHAVRTPSRVDRGIEQALFVLPPALMRAPLPGLVVFQGNPEFGSEQLNAYEMGYRVWPNPQWSMDFTAFYNEYDDLRVVDIRRDLITLGNGYLQLPSRFVNGGAGRTYGFEAAANWRPLDQWRLQFAYSYLQAQLWAKPAMTDALLATRDGSQPRHQFSVLSSYDLRDDLELDLWLHYVAALPDLVTLTVGNADFSTAVDAYFTTNARLAWRPWRDLEVAVIGSNLFGPSRIEFVREPYPFPERVERNLYFQLKWSF